MMDMFTVVVGAWHGFQLYWSIGSTERQSVKSLPFYCSTSILMIF